ncbi:MAG TPA: YggT family protein [Pyrinomonadaceae bacterium]|nr:YggT family protein [Pyrinomonadaceae bacterium]
MIVIGRIFWFIESAFIAFIVGVILLMIIRMIVDKADLNPFGVTHRSVRRLSDDFVIPVRGALREFRADPKFAPLVVILIVVLLGYVSVQLLRTIERTVLGVILSAGSGNLVAVVGTILYGLISIYIILLFIRVIFSLARVSYTNRLMRFLVNITEPLLGPLRRLIPPVGMMDISPIVAFIILWLLQAAVAGTLMEGTRF